VQRPPIRCIQKFAYVILLRSTDISPHPSPNCYRGSKKLSRFRLEIEQRSFKVTDSGTSQKPIFDFLLVINSNLHLHNFITLVHNAILILEACVSVCGRRQVAVVWWLVCVSTPRCRYRAAEYSDTRPTRCLLVMMTSHRSKLTDTVSPTETLCTLSCLCQITRLLLHRSCRWFCLYLLTYSLANHVTARSISDDVL